ncbi:YfbM family protein [Paenibacillus piscarius]|uniref:YfbM family protein n=1 Tax=Paenibacillus piscarius TaxID=1089681 RepID=UPI001EE8CFD7|nr:YfbM family protein [Paenibacillus piscarius]
MAIRGYYFAAEDELVEQIVADSVKLESLDLNSYPGLDIDRSWEAIHYLLCGDISDGPAPLGYVVPLHSDQGVEFGTYGAFTLRAEQVTEALDAISGMDEAQLRQMYDFQMMAEEEVYPLDPDMVADEDADEFFAYLLQFFTDIRQFYTQTAAAGKGAIFYLS